jgi:hypothetical protein
LRVLLGAGWGIEKTLSSMPSILWIFVVALVFGYLLLRTVKAGFQRIEMAIRDFESTIGRLLSQSLAETKTVPNVQIQELPEKTLPEKTLPEGWTRTEPVWTGETVRQLRQWVIDHPDEARVWRIANPPGFRLWAEVLGPEVIRRTWPEDFPGEGTSRSRHPES